LGYLIGAVAGAIALWFFFAAIGGIVLSIAWNAVIPAVFGLPAINFIQGIALAIIGSILFKSPSVSKS
jgi:hypothetical protein